MALFSIDQKKCKRDGICAAECPTQIIVQVDKKAFPSLVEKGEELCINCGHCVAVCPYGALSLSTMPLAACPPIQKHLLSDADTLKQFLQARRSIRRYKKKSIPQKILTELIDTARYAPTTHNMQKVHWIVFQNPEDIQNLAAMTVDFLKIALPVLTDESLIERFQRVIEAWNNGIDRVLRNAPHLIAVHSPSDDVFSSTDCASTLTYLELYANAKGLGTCWAGYFTVASNHHEPLIKALDLPAGYKCFGAVMLGYPQYRYHRIPKRNEPIITWR
jgi:nitroreductase/NAD-dependent dihydropyrimidine dehydrogenase PreA subunit